MQASKKAVYALLTGDSNLMAMLEQAPYMGRLPDGAKISRDKGAISIEGQSFVVGSDKEDQILTLHIWTMRHDVAENIYERLKALMHFGRPEVWKKLATPTGKALIRMQSAIDTVDPTSELFHKVTFWEVKFGSG